MSNRPSNDGSLMLRVIIENPEFPIVVNNLVNNEYQAMVDGYNANIRKSVEANPLNKYENYRMRRSIFDVMMDAEFFSKVKPDIKVLTADVQAEPHMIMEVDSVKLAKEFLLIMDKKSNHSKAVREAVSSVMKQAVQVVAQKMTAKPKPEAKQPVVKKQRATKAKLKNNPE